MESIQEASLKELLASRSPEFWSKLRDAINTAQDLESLIFLHKLRKKGLQGKEFRGKTPSLKVALLGAYTLHPLMEVVEVYFEAEGIRAELFTGEFDNYVAEILEPSSKLYEFKPEVIVLLPSSQRCHYEGKLNDPAQLVDSAVAASAQQLLALAKMAHERSGAEIILGNFIPPARFDLGAFRSKAAGSEWSYRKKLNSFLGEQSQNFVTICDLEFLACRTGLLRSADDRAWFTSKQLCSSELLPLVAHEIVNSAVNLKKPTKKVLVLDLDNTLWGGIVGDDGWEKLELGGHSPRGEAFVAFQRYAKSLIDRGILLAVCSKNEISVAQTAVSKHPEMVLRLEDFVSFKANWNPKPENLKAIAKELGLGLDSFVFVDDNPAEVEIVRQLTPEVMSLCLGNDPADFVGMVQDSRAFEPRALTEEDRSRTEQYRAEAQRHEALAQSESMEAYLASLGMEGAFSEFTDSDLSRIAQLINKSNQFNLTTKRRSEAELEALRQARDFVAFSVRLKDRFGDHGLISVIIGKVDGKALYIDTWLMSCRVLQRGVEQACLNELARLAAENGCDEIRGEYLPTSKNMMVENLLPSLGFQKQGPSKEYCLIVKTFKPLVVAIKILRRAYESERDTRKTAKRV